MTEAGKCCGGYRARATGRRPAGESETHGPGVQQTVGAAAQGYPRQQAPEPSHFDRDGGFQHQPQPPGHPLAGNQRASGARHRGRPHHHRAPTTVSCRPEPPASRLASSEEGMWEGWLTPDSRHRKRPAALAHHESQRCRSTPNQQPLAAKRLASPEGGARRTALPGKTAYTLGGWWGKQNVAGPKALPTARHPEPVKQVGTSAGCGLGEIWAPASGAIRSRADPTSCSVPDGFLARVRHTPGATLQRRINRQGGRDPTRYWPRGVVLSEMLAPEPANWLISCMQNNSHCIWDCQPEMLTLRPSSTAARFQQAGDIAMLVRPRVNKGQWALPCQQNQWSNHYMTVI